MEECGCGQKILNGPLDICRKCVAHNVEIHDIKTFVAHWLCRSIILDPENIRRIFSQRKRVPEQNTKSENTICLECGYSEIVSDLSGEYCRLGKARPIKHCRHFFKPSDYYLPL